MAALALVYIGGRHPLLRLCVAAEQDPDAVGRAWTALDGIEPLTRRRLLAAYASLAAVAAEPR